MIIYREIFKKICLITILSSFAYYPLQAQNTPFNTDGLNNAEFFDFIYRGHFENIDLNREELEFLQFFNSYLRNYGEQCPDDLPADKVKIMNTVCEREWVTKNGYGQVIDRECIGYTEVWSKLYARPDLYAAYLKVEGIFNKEILKNLVDYMSDQDPIGSSVDRIHKINALISDMNQFFILNVCNSLELRKFEENLKLFALNKAPIRMEGESKYVTMKKSGGPTGAQDFTSLIDDLVADQAKTWMLNRYQSGSISRVTFQAQDNQGRPLSLKAFYKYSGFGGSNEGWVKIVFENGLPAGIYFFDYPNNRKTPNSSIVASYAQGDYQR